MDKLLELFPNAKIVPNNTTSTQFICLPFQNKWLQIEQNTLSEREKNLIALLTNTKQPANHFVQTNEWATFFQQPHVSTLPSWHYSTLHIIYLKMNYHDEFNTILWENTLLKALPFINQIVFYSSQHVALLCENSQAIDFSEDIYSAIHALDADFTTQTTIFIGKRWFVSTHLNTLIKEEQKLFNEIIKTTSLTDALLETITKHARQENILLKEINQTIHSLDGGSELVQAMWKAQGNISQAANLLFLHRNSLNYRLDKFQEHVGLSLRQLNSLTICYLACLQ